MKDRAQMIAEALFSIAASIRMRALRERIEYVLVGFVEHAATRSYRDLFYDIDALKALLELGRAAYEIEPMNATMLVNQLRDLESAIRQKFTLPDFEPSSENERAPVRAFQAGSFKESDDAAPQSKSGNPAKSPDAAIRQSTILETVRGVDGGQAHLKDIASALPQVSERTLRYDIQKLIGKGALQRVGNGGPKTYYVIK